MNRKFKSLIRLVRKYKTKIFIFIYIELLKKMRIGSIFRILYLKIFSVSKIGKQVIIKNNIFVTPFTKIFIGDNTYIGHNAIIESKLFKENSRGIIIGKNVWISRDVHIQNSDLIEIKDNVIIGEFVSLRTNKHSINADSSIKNQKMVIGKIIIEKNVWIGRGVIIEGNPEGLIIGENSIIGANSYLKKSIPKNTIYAGNPATFLKKRN